MSSILGQYISATMWFLWNIALPESQVMELLSRLSIPSQATSSVMTNTDRSVLLSPPLHSSQTPFSRTASKLISSGARRPALHRATPMDSFMGLLRRLGRRSKGQRSDVLPWMFFFFSLASWGGIEFSFDNACLPRTNSCPRLTPQVSFSGRRPRTHHRILASCRLVASTHTCFRFSLWKRRHQTGKWATLIPHIQTAGHFKYLSPKNTLFLIVWNLNSFQSFYREYS